MKLALALSALLPVQAAGERAQPRVLRLDATAPFVDATVAGVPMRLRVDMGAPAQVVLDRSAARRLPPEDEKRVLAELIGLKASGNMTLRVGPVSVRGRWTEETLVVDGVARDTRVTWFDRDEADGADGVVGPTALPYDEVALVRRPRGPGDGLVELPARIRGWHGVEAEAAFGGRTVRIGFSLDRSKTLATAAAGQALASAGGGALTGETRRVVVAFGVERPVRTVRLARPLGAAGFRLDQFAMRVSDWAGQGDPPPDADLPPDEVLVRARGERQRAWSKLTIGMDRLSACAEIGFRRRPAAVWLACRS